MKQKIEEMLKLLESMQHQIGLDNKFSFNKMTFMGLYREISYSLKYIIKNDQEIAISEWSNLELLNHVFQFQLSTYLTVVTKDIDDALDNALAKYHPFLRSEHLYPCIPLTGSFKFIGIQELRYRKVQMLVIAIGSKHHSEFGRQVDENELYKELQDMNYLKFGEELKNVFNDLFKVQYRPYVKYLDGIARFDSESTKKFAVYLATRSNSFNEDRILFADFTKLYVLYAIKASHKKDELFRNILRDLLKREKKAFSTKSLDNKVQTLASLNDANSFIDFIGGIVENQVTQSHSFEKLQEESLKKLENSFIQKEMGLSQTDVFWRFLWALLSGHIVVSNEEQYEKDTFVKLINEALHYNEKKGGTTADIWIFRIIGDKKADIWDVLKNLDSQYAYEFHLSKLFSIEPALLLSETYVDYGDIYSVYLSYIMSADTKNHDLSVFTSYMNFKDFNNYSYINSSIDPKINMQNEKAYFIRGILQICLMKQFKVFSRSTVNMIEQDILNSTSEKKGQSSEKLAWAIREENRRLQQELDALNLQSVHQNKQLKILEEQQQKAKRKEELLKSKLRSAEERIAEFKELEIFLEVMEQKGDSEVDSIEPDIDSNEIEGDGSIDYLEEIQKLNIAIVGGHVNFNTLLKKHFPSATTYIDPRNYKYPSNAFDKHDIVVFVAKYNNHSQFKRLKNILIARGERKKLMLINRQPAPKTLAREIYDYLNKEK